jgi:UPF0755 protein
MNKNHYLFLIGAPVVAILLVAIRIYYSMCIWTYTGPDRTFDILPGDNFGKINSQLVKENIISSARLFHRYSQYKGVVNKFKTGRYVIKNNSNMLAVFNTFINEKSLALLFTIPEGKNIYEIAKMLEDKSIVKAADFLSIAKDKSFLKSEGIDADTAEGYLYPETYNIIPNMSAKAILKMMIAQFNSNFKKLNFSEAKFTPFEVLTLASVVEKETGDKKERPMIAGVFLNRLKIKMRLQSDPTTIYGIWENYKGNLTKKDLLTFTEYNTYTISGIPKGPICNPGIKAIEAVLNPAAHKYLYFVSQNDGTHVFSENYEDHQRAVQNWQLNAKNRDGKSWRDHHD